MTFDIVQIALGALLTTGVIGGQVALLRQGERLTIEDVLFSAFLLICALVLVLGGATA